MTPDTVLPDLQSRVLEAGDWDEAVELYHRNGWTDGLPVVPPTPRRVAQFLDAADRPGSDEIGYYAMRNLPVTFEKVAINAVMAGCLPEHFPVVVALVECMLEPDFDIHVANSSTGSLALGFVVNGPIRHELKLNCLGSVLGPGNRGNASIARALRLVQQNVMGSIGGAGSTPEPNRPVLDRSTMGQPAKYVAYHVVENEEAFPGLVPMHVSRGFDRGDSVVSAFTLAGHLMLSTHAEETPEEWIASVSQYVVGAGRLAEDGFGVLLLPIEAASMFVDAGWSKADISRALYEKSCRSTAWVKRNGWKIGGRYERGGAVEPGDEDRILSAAGRPDDIHVVVCGGPAGNFPVYLQTYGATFRMASRRISAGPAVAAGRAVAGAPADIERIRQALSGIRALLRADDYDIEVAGADRALVDIRIVAGPQACAECLVPPAIMRSYLKDALKDIAECRDAALEVRYPQ